MGASGRRRDSPVNPSDRPAPDSVAVMQPYFFPYGGYFGLFVAAETFIIYDDVQFVRRGRVHRCELPGPTGAIEWLTLPLARQPRDVLIRDLAFAVDARVSFDLRLARFHWLNTARGPLAEGLRAHLFGPLSGVLNYLEEGLKLVAEGLRLPVRFLRSSSFPLDPDLRGQARVIELAKAAGARTYVNLSGGRSLYDSRTFADHGLELRFLSPYSGSLRYLLPALAQAQPAEMRKDIIWGTRLNAADE